MYCGTPIIASSTGGILDQVHPDENGYLVEVGDKAGFLNALRRALLIESSRYDAMSASASKSGSEFSLTCIGDKLNQIYKQKIVRRRI